MADDIQAYLVAPTAVVAAGDAHAGIYMVLASIRNFVPDDLTGIIVYMFLVGLSIVPKAIYALCSALGLAWCRLRHTRRNWGNLLPLVLIALTWFMLSMARPRGVSKLVVKRTTSISTTCRHSLRLSHRAVQRRPCRLVTGDTRACWPATSTASMPSTPTSCLYRRPAEHQAHRDTSCATPAGTSQGTRRRGVGAGQSRLQRVCL
jgi:hypothetical protein